jgi:hypothetical protein
MALARLFIGESGVRKAKHCAVAFRRQFDRYPGFGAFGCSGDPGEFYKARALQAKEAAVMRMPLAFKLGFEEEGCIDQWLHHDSTRRGKPEIEPFCPGAEESVNGRLHNALAHEGKRPYGMVGHRH